MLRHYVSTALLTGALLLGLLALSPADNALARATGVVVTVTAIDAPSGIATLITDDGQMFTMPKEGLWQVGSRVECERVEDGSQARLQHCLPWQ